MLRSNRLQFRSQLFSTYCCSPQHLAIRAHYRISLPFMRFDGTWHNPFCANLFSRGAAFTPTPFTLPPCSPHAKADLRPPTWLTPRGSLRLGPPLRGLAALREAALRRRGDRAGRGGRMGSFGSNKRMCDFDLCTAGHTMKSGERRRDGIPSANFFGWNIRVHAVARLNAAAFPCAFTFLRFVLS